ncbi:MAG: hypothetical protein ACJ8HF_27935 [Pseudomonas sp.]
MAALLIVGRFCQRYPSDEEKPAVLQMPLPLAGLVDKPGATVLLKTEIALQNTTAESPMSYVKLGK